MWVYILSLGTPPRQRSIVILWILHGSSMAQPRFDSRGALQLPSSPHSKQASPTQACRCAVSIVLVPRGPTVPSAWLIGTAGRPSGACRRYETRRCDVGGSSRGSAATISRVDEQRGRDLRSCTSRLVCAHLRAADSCGHSHPRGQLPWLPEGLCFDHDTN
ncbi:hypothetical protein BV25DRAFT_104582 [Artomyces pyxidatus]|uniref:Uncharacterized protein n=1 Tax=Artomyces pyxidatus TaxID=48021 RepID=A0ACB8TLB0_9AGAM|nr:hypothetical protein BV25DRAFT_104582 [Artomyces pyxidatus]